jgi:hypothetical protein
MLLSARTTSVDIELRAYPGADVFNKGMIDSVFPTIPIRCSNLQRFSVNFGVGGPIPGAFTIPVGLSTFLLTTNRETLQTFIIDSVLTADGYEVVCRLPNLRRLVMAVKGSNPLPTLVLPSLTTIRYDQGHNWLLGFHEARLGSLDTLVILADEVDDGPAGDFFKAFEDTWLITLEAFKTFRFHTRAQWSPNFYRSLLRSPIPLSLLRRLSIRSCCAHRCAWTTLDDTGRHHYHRAGTGNA